MIHRASTTFLLSILLPFIPVAPLAQSLPGMAGSDAGSAAVESTTAEAEPRIPFDPALVGLPDFPDPLSTPGDYARA